MASSPADSRRRRRRSSMSFAGGHARSSVVLSSSSFSDTQMTPSTFPIPSSSMQPSSNPLLQPDVTPSSLLTNFTPQQLTSHLEALRKDLKGYEAEMKRLINSRYGDILSVGGTISAMKGSSIHLHDKLTQVGQGLRQGGPSTNGQPNAGPEAQKPEDEDERKVRNIASLLTIQQEAPEEIWTILDSVSTSMNQLGALTTSSGRLVALLRCARSLSSAIALYDATRLAGWELDAEPDRETIYRLFPYPLQSRSATLSSIKSEIRSALERILNLATTGEGRTSKTQASQEALFRLTALALLGLVRLNALQPREVATLYLSRRRDMIAEQLTAFVQSSSREVKGEGHRMIAKMMKETQETIIIYSRLFGYHQDGQNNLFTSLLSQMMSNGSASHLSQGSPHATLLPPTPISSLSLLSTSSHVLAMLDPNSGIRDWTPFFEVEHVADNQSPKAELAAWIKFLLTKELNPDASHGAMEIILTHPSLKDLKTIGKIRKKLAQRVQISGFDREGLGSVGPDSGTLMQIVFQHFDYLLISRATKLWTEEVLGWRNKVVGDLKNGLESGKQKKVEARPYEDLFLPPERVAGNGRPSLPSTFSHSLSANHGTDLDLADFVETLHSQWDELQEVKEKYFDALFEDKEVETEQEEQERRDWSQVERKGWEQLFADVEQLVDELKAGRLAVAQNEDGEGEQARRTVILLSRALLRLSSVPANGDVSPFDEQRSQGQNFAVSQRLHRFRSELLNSHWKQFVVAHAGTLLLQSINEPDAELSTKAAEEQRRVSPALIRALHYLDVESGKVVRPTMPTQIGTLEVGTMDDLIISLLGWLQNEMKQGASQRSKLRMEDVETLALLVAKVPPSNDEDGETSEQEAQQALQTYRDAVMESFSSLRADVGEGDHMSTSPRTSEKELLASLSPYALLLGGQVVGRIPPPHTLPLFPQQQQQQAIDSRPPPSPLLSSASLGLAPISGRIRGVQVR